MTRTQGAVRGSFVGRPLSAAAAEPAQPGARGKPAAGARRAEKGALAVDEAQFDAITDQIPQRPMGVVEGTSYTLLILAGVAVAGARLAPSCMALPSALRGAQYDASAAAALGSRAPGRQPRPWPRHALNPLRPCPTLNLPCAPAAAPGAVLWTVATELLLPREYIASLTFPNPTPCPDRRARRGAVDGRE